MTAVDQQQNVQDLEVQLPVNNNNIEEQNMRNKQIDRIKKYINSVQTIMEHTFNAHDQMDEFVSKAQLQNFGDNIDFKNKYEAKLQQLKNTFSEWKQQIDAIQIPNIVTQAQEKDQIEFEQLAEQQIDATIISLNQCENRFLSVNQQFEDKYDINKQEVLQIVRNFQEILQKQAEELKQKENDKQFANLKQQQAVLLVTFKQQSEKVVTQIKPNVATQQQKSLQQSKRDALTLQQKQQKIKQLVIKQDYLKIMIKQKQNQQFIAARQRFNQKYQKFQDFTKLLLSKCLQNRKQFKQQRLELKTFQINLSSLANYQERKQQLINQIKNSQKRNKVVEAAKKIQQKYTSYLKVRQSVQNKYFLCQQRFTQILTKQLEKVINQRQKMLTQYKTLRQKQIYKNELMNQIYQIRKQKKTLKLKVFSEVIQKYTDTLTQYQTACQAFQLFINQTKLVKLQTVSNNMILSQCSDLLKQLQVLVTTWESQLNLKQFKIYQLSQEFKEQQILIQIERLKEQNNQILEQAENIKSNIAKLMDITSETVEIQGKSFNYQKIDISDEQYQEQLNSSKTKAITKGFNSPYRDQLRLRQKESPKVVLQKLEIEQNIQNIEASIQRKSSPTRLYISQKLK